MREMKLKNSAKEFLLSEKNMAKILIVYHSQTGNTQKMAHAVAEGARRKKSSANLLLFSSARVTTEQARSEQ